MPKFMIKHSQVDEFAKYAHSQDVQYHRTKEQRTKSVVDQ